MATLKLGVLISGRGTNLQALIDRCAEQSFPAEIAVVISNRGDAAGLARAAEAGIATEVIPHGDYDGRAAFDAEVGRALERHGVGLVCLAGFMRLLGTEFVDCWRDRLINIHPSLLPAFKGLDTHARALEAGVRFTGCTVHFVRAEMDVGPILVQAAVPVRPGDTEDTLAARVLAAEHRAYPSAVRLIAEGRVRVVDERGEIDGARAPEPTALNPRDD